MLGCRDFNAIPGALFLFTNSEPKITNAGFSTIVSGFNLAARVIGDDPRTLITPCLRDGWDT